MYRVILQLVFVAVVCVSCVSNKVSKRYARTFHEQSDTVRLMKECDSLRMLSNKDYLVRNRYGNWELYVSGESYNLGNRIGLLTEDLFRYQQRVFMNKLEDMVPSRFKQRLVSKFIHWYGRRLDDYIPTVYLDEIYGLSSHLNGAYPYAGDNFSLTLFMHAAHDLGHALRDLAIVGCSSVASWGDKTEDGKLLIGRNFDFYVDDAFAENKVVNFVRPESGIPFVSISWPGMVGVVSGMNKEGLTVTMNAGKSSIPLSAKKPISIVAREILEKASTIEEATAIAKGAQSFVSESLMIGSAKDKKAVLLEISPKKFGVYEVENGDQLVCTNHFQSNSYVNDERNITHIQNSHSKYRYDRLLELLNRENRLNPTKMAMILRNRLGISDENIGYGNDKSLNHLLAHHAVIFKPEDKLVWVSSAPYQLGVFTAYNLDDIFSEESVIGRSHQIDSLTIDEDSFVRTSAYKNYENYKCESDSIMLAMRSGVEIPEERMINFKALNPNLWLVYYLAGKYWYKRGDYDKAVVEFSTALTLEIPTVQVEKEIRKLWEKSNRKQKK
ncbi:Predicted choloylglycine hydrolase [Sphingobacterium nematocida]|uniref:Predicted choloylglycine hydrolase n=1 Tax=Sphingobacterium nematocida TaxID=1513896 RepID=A0A1T5EQF7_9SPHI|nr:C45 family peptidase [Sphingobacterium nematocida]SKB85920.1 Predicted choloylglycine hydrolase [Sphingobacterium nematocida]